LGKAPGTGLSILALGNVPGVNAWLHAEGVRTRGFTSAPPSLLSISLKAKAETMARERAKDNWTPA